MALNYPGYSVPQPTDLTLLDVYGEWNKGVEKGKAHRFEREAPEQFANAAAPLSEYGLSTPPDQLKAMFANPETRPMALQMVQEATQRRADASDPMKQLQLRKAQLDVAAAERGPAAPRNTVLETANTRFRLGRENGLTGEELKRFTLTGELPDAAAPPKPLTDVAKLKSDLDAGLITKEQYDAVVAKELQGSGGLSVTTNADGTVSVQQGGPAGPKLTEGQSKDAFYYIRGAGSNKALEENEASLTSLSDTVAGGMPLVGNYFTSDGFKNANRDGKEFLASVLRKDSGGAITPDEWAYYGPMYLPAPGDGPDQLARKRDARKRAMDALKATSGPGQIVIDEYDRQNAPPPVAGAAPDGVDPGTWEFMTPEERALWQN